MFSYTIKLGDKDVRLMQTGRTAVYYEQIFKEDLLLFMLVDANSGANDADAVKVAQKLCYVMMNQAEGTDMRSLTLDSYYDWLDTVSQIDLIKHTVEIIATYKEDMETLSEAKKKEEEQSAE